MTQRPPAELLHYAAEALTACHSSGLDLSIKHGILSCPEGFIMQLDDGSFVARTRFFTEFSRLDDDDLKVTGETMPATRLQHGL